EIYEEALDALLKKWDSSRQIRRGGLYKTLSLGRKRQMFARIAYDAFARSEIVFPQASLEAWLKAYLVNVPELPAAVDIDAEAVLQEIVAQHGIFAEQARHLFSFAHLTFQEYYAASYVAESMNAGVLDTLLAHVTDAKWREVFLLTASLLPDATMFLERMLRAVNGMAMQATRVKALVQVIGERAGESQAGYIQPAIRLHYFARALDFDRDRDREVDLARAIARALDFDFARAIAHDLYFASALDRARDIALARDLALHLDLAIARDLARDLDFARARALVSLQKDLVVRCRQQGRVALHDALAAIQVPADSAEPAVCQVYADALAATVDASGELAAYRRLQDETEALVETERSLLASMDENDSRLMEEYMAATRFFHDCLQVAYTADRRAIEDRILTLPD
ncbi:MAG: hypothetical protein KDE01_27885, partial [Caldilineaceae bacterium]|nr:hypothetical protein [Caldilineaceae bacterium]